ncbi:hypothetical protein D3C76_1427240 [compost metagenome]
MAPTNQNQELPTIERDTAGVWPSPRRKVAHDWVKMFHSSFICGDAALARGIHWLDR